jgi:hypothetical protein
MAIGKSRGKVEGRDMVRRTTTIAGVITLLLALGTISALASSPDPSPFVGVWQGTDVDDSNVTITITGHDTRLRVELFDDDVTGGGCDTQGPGTAIGTGVVDGNTLNVTFNVLLCEDRTHPPLRNIPSSFEFDPTEDTLTDVNGVEYNRV